MTEAQLAFAAFAIVTQASLLAFFAARRRRPAVAERFGWVVYALGGLGLPLGVWLLVDGQSPQLFVGPSLMAGWALVGWVVDLWRPRPWRGPPVQWRVLVPYVALYFAAQMFLWWPLANIARPAWVLILLLFVPSTALNIRGHVDGGAVNRGTAPHG